MFFTPEDFVVVIYVVYCRSSLSSCRKTIKIVVDCCVRDDVDIGYDVIKHLVFIAITASLFIKSNTIVSNLTYVVIGFSRI